MTRETLVAAFHAYEPATPEEQEFVSRFLRLLEHPRCFHRDHLPGHITGSAWVINNSGTHTLMVHHAKLRRWLQPGGHADGEENVFDVALREAQEETGVRDFTFHNKLIFDIDIHRIPERAEFPEHDHYDVRFQLFADDRTTLAISDESTDLRWIALDRLHEYTNERSVLRMREKSTSK